eukprot:EG_transcript_11420
MSDSAPPRPRKRRRAGAAARPRLAVHVVDNHDVALQPLCAAWQGGRLPRQGLSLLHFDSHPDMGLATFEPALVSSLHNGTYPVPELRGAVDVATWLLPLVYAGHVSTVVWVCGAWCQQMEPGTYALCLGRDSGGTLRVSLAAQPDLSVAEQRCHGALRYWAVDGGAAQQEELSSVRSWTLHVVQCDEGGLIGSEDEQRIRAALGTGPWLLDIDEDFFTCSNPHREKFHTMFGEERYRALWDVYRLEADDAYYTALRDVVEGELFRLPLPAFRRCEAVRTAAQALGGSGPRKLRRLRRLCRMLFGEENEDSLFLPAQFFTPDELHHTGMQVHLPYHISGLELILQLVSTAQRLLQTLPSPPGLVTVATSREDRYVPEVQAYTVHSAVLQMLRATYPVGEVHRLDLRKLSIEEDVEEESDIE